MLLLGAPQAIKFLAVTIKRKYPASLYLLGMSGYFHGRRAMAQQQFNDPQTKIVFYNGLWRVLRPDSIYLFNPSYG
jgi:hypothetical protein